MKNTPAQYNIIVNKCVSIIRGCVNVFGILAKNRLLARGAQNGVSMFVSVYRAGPRARPAREQSFGDALPETV